MDMKFKKTIALLVTMAVLLAFAIPSFAEGEPVEPTYSFTENAYNPKKLTTLAITNGQRQSIQVNKYAGDQI